jgi:hypothetical protein
MKFKNPWTQKNMAISTFSSSSSKYGEFGPFEKEKENLAIVKIIN